MKEGRVQLPLEQPQRRPTLVLCLSGTRHLHTHRIRQRKKRTGEWDGMGREERERREGRGGREEEERRKKERKKETLRRSFTGARFDLHVPSHPWYFSCDRESPLSGQTTRPDLEGFPLSLSWHTRIRFVRKGTSSNLSGVSNTGPD